MTHIKHGMGARKATPIKIAAGGYHTTTATTNNAAHNIAIYARIESAIVHFTFWLAVTFRGFL